MSKTAYQRWRRDEIYRSQKHFQELSEDVYERPRKLKVDHLSYNGGSYMVHFDGLYKPVNIIDSARHVCGRLTKDMRNRIEACVPEECVVEGNVRSIYQQGKAYNYGGYRCDFYIHRESLLPWLWEASGQLDAQLSYYKDIENKWSQFIDNVSDWMKQCGYDIRIEGFNEFSPYLRYSSDSDTTGHAIYLSGESQIRDVMDDIIDGIARDKSGYYSDRDSIIIPEKYFQQHKTDESVLVLRTVEHDNSSSVAKKKTVYFVQKSFLQKTDGGYHLKEDYFMFDHVPYVQYLSMSDGSEASRKGFSSCEDITDFIVDRRFNKEKDKLISSCPLYDGYAGCDANGNKKYNLPKHSKSNLVREDAIEGIDTSKSVEKIFGEQ